MKKFTELEETLLYSLSNKITKNEAIDLFRSMFFVCPRCGVIYDRKIGKYGGLCCNHCVTPEDLDNIANTKENIAQQIKELYNECI